MYEFSASLEAEDLSIGDTVTLKVHVNRILLLMIHQKTKSGNWVSFKVPDYAAAPAGREETYKITIPVKPFEGTHQIRIRAGTKAKHKRKGEGLIEKVFTFEVEKENEEPTARCDYSPSDPEKGEEITFSGSDSYDSDGYIEGYDWYFDRSLGSLLSDEQGETVSHTFDEPGSHKVHLEVNDNDGATDSTTCSGSITRSFEVQKKVKPSDRAKSIVESLESWEYKGELLVNVTFNSKKFHVFDLAAKDDRSKRPYLPLDEQGNLPPSPEAFRKIVYTAQFAQGAPTLKNKCEPLAQSADKFLTYKFAGEVVLEIRDTASNLLGTIIGALGTGGGNVPTKIAAQESVKQATKQFAKEFAKSLAKNIIEDNLELSVANALDKYAKTELSEGKKFCKKVIDTVEAKSSYDPEKSSPWSWQEVKSVKDNYQSCTTKITPNISLLSKMNPDAAIFSQLKDVTSEVISGATGVDPKQVADMFVKVVTAPQCGELCQALKEYQYEKTGVKERASQTVISDSTRELANSLIEDLVDNNYLSES